MIMNIENDKKEQMLNTLFKEEQKVKILHKITSHLFCSTIKEMPKNELFDNFKKLGLNLESSNFGDEFLQILNKYMARFQGFKKEVEDMNLKEGNKLYINAIISNLEYEVGGARYILFGK